MMMAARAGLMSGQDKKKLDEFSAVSNEAGKYMGADGRWSVPKDDDSWATEHLTISSSTEGLDVKRSSGSVEFTIPYATTVSAGVMSSADKIKLDGAASVGHTHTEYALANHNHDTAYASSTHVHAASAITSGTLAIANGGTGASDTATALTNLGAAVSGHKHAAGDITSGTLAVARGGTGQTTLAKARKAMGLGNTTGAVPIANGGTGAKTAAAALTNLGAAAASHAHSGYATLTFTAVDSGTCRIELNGVI